MVLVHTWHFWYVNDHSHTRKWSHIVHPQELEGDPPDGLLGRNSGPLHGEYGKTLSTQLQLPISAAKNMGQRTCEREGRRRSILHAAL